MFTKDNAKEFGRKGGRATVERHGGEHMRHIGKKGHISTTEKHFEGNEEAHGAYLAQLGRWVYWKHTGLRMKLGPDGKPIWRKPRHPAHDKELPF